jgi:hypothetical protein
VEYTLDHCPVFWDHLSYTVNGLLGDDKSRFIRREKAGMRLFLDLGKLKKPHRKAAIKDLKDIIARLEN